jgi:hypothetical protein
VNVLRALKCILTHLIFFNDLKNVFSNGGVESFKFFPQSFDCCLHYHNTMSLLKPFANFKYRLFFFRFVFVSGFVPLVVDHVTKVVVASGCDSQFLVAHSQLLEGLKCESQIENSGRVRSWGTLPGL